MPTTKGDCFDNDCLNSDDASVTQVAELSDAVTLLREEIRQKEESFGEERVKYVTRIDELEREKQSLTENMASIETQLAEAPSQSTVELMKRELRILKRLEYNADDFDNERDPEMTGEDESKDLESVLIAKLRRVESELVKERNGRVELVEELHRLQSQVADLEASKEAAEKLVVSLEKDLELAISVPTSATPRRAPSSTQIVSEGSEAATLQSVLDPEAPAPPPSTPTVAQKTAAEKAEDDHSVATIIMAQRDRLRARCELLEAERDSFKRELQMQVAAAESLKTDNTKLYEKVRYLQNYSKSSGAALHRPGLDRDLDLEALEQRYEASVDPFKQFSKAERQRKMKEMSPVERTVFLVARTFLATKEMRAFLFVYVVSLHLLVFVTTYHWSHTGSECHVDNEHVSHLAPHEMEAHVAAEKGIKSG